MIVIVDYGMGNLRSIQSKLHMIEFDSVVSADPSEISKATKLILPGVGHYTLGMKNLHDRGLVPALNEAVLSRKVPVLGICLGMQLLASSSEETSSGEKTVAGLGWFDASVKRFPKSDLPVPHVGWNNVARKSDCILYRDIVETKPFYFTHSYYWEMKNAPIEAGTTDYIHEFVSVVQKDNVYGTQFHPEKSRKYGLKMIENFLRYS